MTDKTIKFSGKGQPGDLLDPSNWIGGVVPGITDTSLITTNVGGPVGGTFSVNNMMLLGAETITFTGTLDTAGVGACQGLMVCDGATAIFAPGAVLNDGNIVIVGNDAVGSLVAMGGSTLNTVDGNIGKQDAGIGTVTIDDAVWANSGHVVIGDDGTGVLKVIHGGSVLVGGDVDIAADAGAHGMLAIASGGSVTVDGSLRAGVAAGKPTGSASIKIGAGGLTVDAMLSIGGGSELDVAGGTIVAGVTADCLRALPGGVLAGFGTVTAPLIQDNGTILATGGTLRIDGDLVGTGAIQIAANSKATLTGDSLKLAAIAFIGTDGTLALAHGSTVTAAISGFAIGDAISMANIDAVSFNPATGKLTISEANTQVETLRFAGGFAGESFAIHQTAGGGLITLQQIQISSVPVLTAQTTAHPVFG